MARQPARPSAWVAADFSWAALQKGAAYAESESLLNIAWQQHDIQSTGFASDSFDTVVSSETIEHVPDPARAVRELARVLKPGGVLFLTTPNYFGPYGIYRAYLRAVGRPYTEAGQPINKFVMLPRTISWIRRAGMRVSLVDAVGYYWLWPGRVPRRLAFMDTPRAVTRWCALHTLVVAEKL